MKLYKDQTGREFILQKTPVRIISLVPSLTELLVDMGLENFLVGITKFCVHPEHLREEKKIVGGTKKVKIEVIEGLQPDIILCNKEENTLEMVMELEKLAPVHVSEVRDIKDTLDLVSQYGELFDRQARAEDLISQISLSLADFEAFMQDKPTRKVAYFIWKNPWMVAGKNTFIDHLLQINKFENVYQDEDSRYPEISLKSLRERNVELVLLSSEPYPFRKDHKAEVQKILDRGQVKIVNGESFSWYGSRLLSAFSYFKSFQASLCSF